MKKLIVALAALLGAAWFAPAQAANCSGYPYTLTNGQTADATQVMADFNAILSCANTNLAKNGANSDITSLSGLTTPLSTGQGGTGQATSIFSTANTWATTQTFATPTTSIASINLPPGVAPTAPNNGDMWTTSGGLFVRVNGTTFTALTASALHVRNQQATGVANPENFQPYVSVWTGRTLNTTVTNTITGASLASNQVTLPAGTYEVQMYSTLYWSGSSSAPTKHRLYNVTDGAALLYGQTLALDSDGSTVATGVSSIIGQFTLSGTKAVALQLWQSGGAMNNMGTAISDGSPEVYTDLYIRKIG